MRIYRALFIKVDINQLLVIKEDLMKTQLLQQVVLLILGIAISTRAFPKAIPTNKQTHSTNANEEQYP